VPNSILTSSLTQSQSQSSESSEADSRLEYRSMPGVIDEAYSEADGIKPEWEYLLNSLGDLGSKALFEREDKARRILRDDGATYNIYGSESNPSSSWELDLVPSVIGSDDWATIEAGLLERSELFNLMLRDFYGPRTLFKHRALPPEALYCHGGFLRACQGIRMPGEHELIVHSVDMVRRADGSMCVLSDRTQVPSGAGYVLENRTVMSRVFPSLFRDSHVHRLANFYQRLRLKLMALSPTEEMPRIVLLTPGAQNETYFEHAYLANYLGYPLVQSGDLVVRNGFVWMKSLEGLERVDVILRRVDDVYCDPVELRSDSQLGVPGMLDVVRSGRVVIANPLGAGVLENPILLKYLPEISKCLLGRELRLDSVKTYWCGDDDDLKYILEHINELIIKPAYRGSGLRSVWGGDLTKQQTAELASIIKSKRYQYVAQERLQKAHIPSFTDGQLKPRPAILRSFAVATEGSYTVMPGGLTRTGLEVGGQIISMQSGCPSKDTWITASEPERVSELTAAPEAAAVAANTPLISLPSRVVENLYWLGRYAERAEGCLRVLRTVFVMLNGEDRISEDAKRILLRAVTKITATQPGFANASDEMFANPDEELLLIIRDGKRAGSIKSTLNSMLYCADESKELLSSDTMRVINDLRDGLDSLDSSLAGGLASAPEEALDPLVTALVALSGLTQESMVRGVGWHFMEMGKRVERAMHVINNVGMLMAPVAEHNDNRTMLTAMLTSMEVLITYRRRHRERMGIELGLDLVMLDSTNPRSLIFQFEQLKSHFDALQLSRIDSSKLTEEERALLEAITSLKLSRMGELLETETSQRENLKNFLTQLENLLSDFSNIVSDKYFDHRIDPQQLVTTYWGDQS
jgi:uncharacterized circularly permuted ATP-grasp superfamily protein/uncharacterized alpha-E superfamily protein